MGQVFLKKIIFRKNVKKTPFFYFLATLCFSSASYGSTNNNNMTEVHSSASSSTKRPLHIELAENGGFADFVSSGYPIYLHV